MADKKDGGHGHGPNANLIAICVAVVAVAIAASSIWGSSGPTRPDFRPTAAGYSASSSGNPNADIPTPGFVVRREKY